VAGERIQSIRTKRMNRPRNLLGRRTHRKKREGGKRNREPILTGSKSNLVLGGGGGGGGGGGTTKVPWTQAERGQRREKVD